MSIFKYWMNIISVSVLLIITGLFIEWNLFYGLAVASIFLVIVVILFSKYISRPVEYTILVHPTIGNMYKPQLNDHIFPFVGERYKLPLDAISSEEFERMTSAFWEEYKDVRQDVMIRHMEERTKRRNTDEKFNKIMGSFYGPSAEGKDIEGNFNENN